MSKQFDKIMKGLEEAIKHSDPQERKQVIVVRKDLKSRRGKECSQSAHASLAAILDLGFYSTLDGTECLCIPLDSRVKPWITGRFKKICVSVDSEKELLDVYKQADEAGLICSLIKDAGLTEFGGVPTFTAVAIGPDLPENIDKITGNLKLY